MGVGGSNTQSNLQQSSLLLKRRGDTVAYGSEFPEQTLISLSGQAGIVYCTPLGVGLFAYWARCKLRECKIYKVNLQGETKSGGGVLFVNRIKGLGWCIRECKETHWVLPLGEKVTTHLFKWKQGPSQPDCKALQGSRVRNTLQDTRVSWELSLGSRMYVMYITLCFHYFYFLLFGSLCFVQLTSTCLNYKRI